MSEQSESGEIHRPTELPRRRAGSIWGIVVLLAVIVVAVVACFVVLNALSTNTYQSSSSSAHSCQPPDSPMCPSQAVPAAVGPARAAAGGLAGR
ncbi:MAG TPA: hypothetical protein VEL82_06920 [Thermoplasmata archaeon]|nr:hypothetical protein [Thermoplasmata archaeon]